MWWVERYWINLLKVQGQLVSIVNHIASGKTSISYLQQNKLHDVGMHIHSVGNWRDEKERTTP